MYVMFGALFTSLVNAYIEVPFARPLKVSEPCKGLGGFREFCEQGNLPYESVNAMDIEWRFRAFYEKLAAVNGKTYDVSGFHEVRGSEIMYNNNRRSIIHHNPWSLVQPIKVYETYIKIFII